MNLREAFEEISEYLQIDLDEIMGLYSAISKKYKGFNKWSHLSEEEFNSLKLDIRDSEQLRNFYANTDNYIFELMEYHSTEEKGKMRQRCIEIMKKLGVKNVLDYGCGIGQDNIDAANAGLKAIACDIPGKTLDFAKWRFKKRKLDIDIITIMSEKPLKEKYDAITCFEVIMHTTDPIGIIRHIYKHLQNDGLLFFTARFKGYSLALRYNQKYEGVFDDIIQDIGFKRLYKDHMWGPKNKKGKFLFVYQKI